MENVMEIPLIPKIIALICCAIVFGLVCTWGVLWPWLVSVIKGASKFVFRQSWHSATVTLKGEQHLLSGAGQHFAKPKHPKAA